MNFSLNNQKIVLILILFVNINFISASVEFGNLSHSINKVYGKSEPLNGWINVSFVNESSSTLLFVLGYNLTLSEFLNDNGIDCSITGKCSCFPTDCSEKYTFIGSPMSSKTYTLNLLRSKVIGIKLTGNLTKVFDFGFNVSTDADKSCLSPLLIDLLDDKNLEWSSKKVSNNTCYTAKPYGCFNISNTQGNATIGSDPMCAQIELVKSKGYRVGGYIYGSGNARFHMSLEAGGSQENCFFDVNSDGEKYCNIIFDEPLPNNMNGTLCIFKDEQNTNSYKINFEDVNPCGFIDDAEKSKHDFEIFAMPLMYESLDSVEFNQKLFDNEINLSSIISNYIDEKYGGKCLPECIIPLRFYSGVDQDIMMSNINLKYKSDGLEKNPITDFYEISVQPFLISSGFLRLELDNSGFLTPSSVGTKNISLKISDKEIKEMITINDSPVIKDILPKEGSLLVPINFVAILENASKTYIYNWNFGDGTPLITTSSNKASHTYSNIGVYTVILNFSDGIRENFKSIKVDIKVPFDAINETLQKYKKNLKDVDNDIGTLESWLQEYAIEGSNIEELKSSVSRLENKFKETFKDEEQELIKIMNELSVLDIPFGISSSYKINPTTFSLNENRFNALILEEIGAGTSIEEDYFDPTIQWIDENIDIKFESQTYSVYYNDKDKIIFSNVELLLTNKQDIEEFFIVIEGDVSKIKFKDNNYDIKELSEGYGIKLRDLKEGGSEKIEFIYPEKIDISNLPIYVSPLFDELDFGVEPGVCNFNRDCEKNLGEDYKNCRADCKPWKLTFLFLFILLIVVFIIYILMQEWYKKYYESYLFKDKNQLFNLIAFMSNAKNQKLDKNEIFNRLRQRGWKTEQLNYAWRRLHNQNNLMFEIPIFRIIEKRKVVQELDKRKNLTGSNIGLTRRG